MEPSTAARHAYHIAALVLFSCPALIEGQSSPGQVGAILSQEILRPAVANAELRQHIVERVPLPPAPSSARQFSEECALLRKHLLTDIVFHGWPKEWVDSPPRFEEAGVVQTGPGYRARKFRYEIVPGFQSSAILYEPVPLTGKVPAILNVHGHVGPVGKAVEFKQKRCINYAKRGIIALNLEWLAFGDLANPENEHWFGAHLDLVGANEAGLFYLAMRRGLDYLYAHESVDRSRIGMTGLSGGGWQTILLSSLDERVKATAPVAGFSSVRTKVEVREFGDLGDLEQSATDLFKGLDYTYLVALMAPRPTLLTYNAEDDCCFRAPMVKPLVYDAIKPVFRLYGKEDLLQWHENRDPGTHNYQLDNRLASYRFFSEQFGLPVIAAELPTTSEIKDPEELAVALPNNLTTLGLARRFAAEITREPVAADPNLRSQRVAAERDKLREVLRYKSARLSDTWGIANTKNNGVESKAYLFKFSNGLSADGVVLRGIDSPDAAPTTIVLHDEGKEAAQRQVSDAVNRGEQVLAADLLFFGRAWKDPEPSEYVQILHGLGERPLGMEVAQLIELSHWINSISHGTGIRLEASGLRSQVVAQVAAALAPELFSHVLIHSGVSTLGYLLSKPVTFQEAPELFCLDLYKAFDLNQLDAMAAPARVSLTK